MSPMPPSKNGASGWYLPGSMVFEEKSSAKTTWAICPEAWGMPRLRTRSTAAAMTTDSETRDSELVNRGLRGWLLLITDSFVSNDNSNDESKFQQGSTDK